MPNVTLPAFSQQEKQKAHIYLATHVAEMMGRKFEEGDWAKVYCAAKGIPLGTWSNLNIDITHGNLGVEHKMICRRSHLPILEACGTSIMHPAGTRAIRIPDEDDATLAARIVLQQYSDIIEQRTQIVRIINDYHHDIHSAVETIDALKKLGMSQSSARAAIPSEKSPIGNSGAAPDMRMGWLLWQENLREFLYFEEPMTKPNPNDYVAEWRESGGGRRKKSRNLWVYNNETRAKVYSITTEAGAKIQPYFTVPMPNDPNLCHFIAQGEDFGNGLIRVWLTKVTADLLKNAIGNLAPETIATAVERADFEQRHIEATPEIFGTLAVEVLIPNQAYARLQAAFNGVSDEHNFKQLVELLHSSSL